MKLWESGGRGTGCKRFYERGRKKPPSLVVPPESGDNSKWLPKARKFPEGFWLIHLFNPLARFKLRKALILPFLVGTVLLFSLHAPAFCQSCAPVSAQFLASGDDTTYAWINGTSLGVTFNYCASNSCVATPVPVPTTLFNEGQSLVLAVETDNVNPNLVFSAWALVVDCSGGFQEVVSSQSYAAVSLYYDPNGAGAGVTGCSGAGASPPPLDGANNPWTSFVYNPAPVSNLFTMTGAPITAMSYSAPISVNGIPIPPISYNASGYVSGSCGILYWRQVIVFPTPTPTATATLTPTFTPTPTPTASFTQTFSPTSTFTPTVTFTPTDTLTSTLTFTHTDTSTPTFTATVTDTPTQTSTPTNTPTPTFTFTPCGFPGDTCTPTPTPPIYDVFTVDRNVLRPSQGPASILVEYSLYPGSYSLLIFNSAGEHIKTLDSQTLNEPISQVYTWNGTNKYGDACASGVYILSLQEPYSQKFKRILLIR